MAKIPAKIGKYDITKKVAEGGMGAVYKGIHPTLNKDVILKKLTLSDDEHISERFKREARIMMDFKNDNIVDVYDHFKAGGSYYIVLEYVDGIALDELIRKERYLPNDTALLIFLEASKALKYAHDKNVIHRDIKPGNILISKHGEIKLVDFGIASISDDDETNLTRDGMTLGTPSYMAPEQFNNSKSVDKRADIYSMGVMLYEMVTGKKPYPGNYSPETLAKIQKGKYVSPVKHNPAINNQIARIIGKCMKSRADRRYRDLTSIIVSLEKYFKKHSRENARKVLIGKITGGTIDLPVRSKPVIKKILSIVLILALLGAGGYGLYLSGYYHELLTSSTYGAFRIQMKIPRGDKTPGDIFIKAFFFVDDDGEIPSVDSSFRFRVKEEGESFYILESNSIYAPAGTYRIKIKCEDELFWGSFPLKSVKDTKLLSGGSKIQTFSFEAQSPEPRALHIRSRVLDFSSGEDITKQTGILINSKGKWVPLYDQKTEFLSGNIYKIRFERENYRSKEFSLKIDVYQSELDLTVYLEPIKASISLSSDEKGFRVSLESSNPSLLPAEITLESEPAELELYPGVYTLKITGHGLEENAEIKITSKSKINLSVLYDSENKKIILEGLENDENR